MAKCEICDEAEMKYTCPKCGTKYCSLACFKSETHKLKDAAKVEEIEIIPEPIQETKTSEEQEQPPHSDDPMIDALIKDEKFQYYLKSPPLQLHILTIVEILNNISLTNEYSSDGRKEIASKKINNLRTGGLESNEWVNEFFEWLTEWMEKWENEHKDK